MWLNSNSNAQLLNAELSGENASNLAYYMRLKELYAQRQEYNDKYINISKAATATTLLEYSYSISANAYLQILEKMGHTPESILKNVEDTIEEIKKEIASKYGEEVFELFKEHNIKIDAVEVNDLNGIREKTKEAKLPDAMDKYRKLEKIPEIASEYGIEVQ